MAQLNLAAKGIGVAPAAPELIEKAAIGEDAGVVELTNGSAKSFLKVAAKGRNWDRETDPETSQ